MENGLADCVADFNTVAFEEFPNAKVTRLSMKRFMGNPMMRSWSQKILVGKVLNEFTSEKGIDGVQLHAEV